MAASLPALLTPVLLVFVFFLFSVMLFPRICAILAVLSLPSLLVAGVAIPTSTAGLFSLLFQNALSKFVLLYCFLCRVFFLLNFLNHLGNLGFYFPAIYDFDLEARHVTAVALKLLNHGTYFKPFLNSAEDHVLAVEPASWLEGHEELRPICVFPSVC